MSLACIVGALAIAALFYAAHRQEETERGVEIFSQAEITQLDESIRQARLSAIQNNLRHFEERFGRVERLRLQAFDMDANASNVQNACDLQRLNTAQCRIMETNRQALYWGFNFIRPPIRYSGGGTPAH